MTPDERRKLQAINTRLVMVAENLKSGDRVDKNELLMIIDDLGELVGYGQDLIDMRNLKQKPGPQRPSIARR